ncbi:MAG: hypothetical protein AB1716_11550 [Planctomycetota bacterium]
MTRAPQPAWEALLDDHLDGRLDVPARRDFERLLGEDLAAGAALQLQNRIDAALRRRIRPGDARAAWARVEAAQRAGRVRALQRQRRWLMGGGFAAAAMLVLAIGAGVWRTWPKAPHVPEIDDQGYAVKPWRTFEMVYRDEVDAGFQCEWECKTEREFAGTFHKRFGQGLLLGKLPAGARALGLSYCNTLSKRTVILLARVQEQPVLVFIDQPGKYQDLNVAPNSGLHLFKRDLGGLVLCEVTPLDRPWVLDAFYDPQQPASWYEEAGTQPAEPPQPSQPSRPAASASGRCGGSARAR